jgi:hypothetical protein
LLRQQVFKVIKQLIGVFDHSKKETVIICISFDMDSSSLVSFGHTKGVHSNVAALEVSQHWDDLNLTSLLMTEEERSPEKKQLPSGQMNIVLGEDDGTPRSKNPDGSPVKVTKEVIVQRHKKKWEKSNHSVLKDRYGAQPHKPPAMLKSSLERLANPIMGRYKSQDEYLERVSSAKDAKIEESEKRNKMKQNGITREQFFAGDDDKELSPHKKSGNNNVGGGGFFLTATEDGGNSPQKGTSNTRSMRRGERVANRVTAVSRNRSSSRGPSVRDPLISGTKGGGRVNSLRNRVQEAGFVNQAKQGANRMRSTTRANKLNQSVLDAQKKKEANSRSRLNADGTRKRGTTPAATGSSAIRSNIKSSGYGSVAGMSRINTKPSVRGVRGVNSTAPIDADASVDRGRRRGNPLRGRFGASQSGGQTSSRGTSRSRGASVSRTVNSRTSSSAINNRTTPGLSNAEKAAARRAAAAESRANASQSRSNLRSSASDSRLRSNSAQAVGRPGIQRSAGVPTPGSASGASRGGVAGGGGLAAIRERKQVSSAPIRRRGKSIENDRTSQAKQPAITNTISNKEEKEERVFTPPILQKKSEPISSKIQNEEKTKNNEQLSSPKKDKRSAAPLSKKDMLKTAAWRPTNDILRTLAGVQAREEERIKASQQTLASPNKMPKSNNNSNSPDVEDLENENNPDAYTTKGIAKRYNAGALHVPGGSALITSVANKENSKNSKYNSKKIDKTGANDENLTSALMEKATKLQSHFDSTNKGFVVDEAEALAQSIDTATGVPDHIRPKMAMNRGPQTGRGGGISPKKSVNDQSPRTQKQSDAQVEADREAFARMLAADQRSPISSPIK